MRLRALEHRKTCIKFVLIAFLAVGLCMTPCATAGHHGAAGASFLCTVDLPQIFQLIIVMNMLLFALSTLILVPQTPAFSLLKPPRFGVS